MISKLNHSRSKMQYTIPKAERFPNRRTDACDRIYDFPPVSSTRATTLCYGKKASMGHTSFITPSPNSYKLSSIFDEGQTRRKGCFIGLGRDETVSQGPMASLRHNAVPGPGNYGLDSTLSKIRYSMRGRIKDQKPSLAQGPGPGTYHSIDSINRNGKYTLSKYRSNGAPILKASASFLYHNEVPGPGAYECRIIGKSQPIISFSQAKRLPQAPSNYPGPGNYNHFSQFQRTNIR